jgi:hypothetical protein
MRIGTLSRIVGLIVGLAFYVVACGGESNAADKKESADQPVSDSGGYEGIGAPQNNRDAGPVASGGVGGSSFQDGAIAGIGSGGSALTGTSGAAGRGMAGVAGARANLGGAGGAQGQDAGKETGKGEKIGVLFLGVGTDETYKIDWAAQFMSNLFDYFPAGFFAGGKLEGGNCYTLIHYANDAEAAACQVERGTPIDARCNEYKNENRYPVQSLNPISFLGDCYSDIVPYFALSGHSTVNPVTGAEITAPVVTDPNGTGMGIADFIEAAGFSWMERFSRLPNNKDVHREQLLRWWYGNDAKGYAPETAERSNIKDRLQESMPNVKFVFRHGWESYMENTDIYGAPKVYPDSTETAIQELINDEKVNRIVVLHTYPGFANMTQYGHDWFEPGDKPTSAVDGETFTQCVTNINDTYGPTTSDDLNNYLTNKPWNLHDKHPFPLIRSMVKKANPAVKLSFAPAYGKYAEFSRSIIELIRYTVDKYKVAGTSSLKVVLAHHGYGGGYMNSQQCDSYARRADETFNGIKEVVNAEFAWKGRFELVHAAGEFAEQQNPMAVDDPATEDKPFGNVMSVGEEVEKAMNGQYVNELGKRVDNGTDNFEYIVVIPYYFESESSDTLYGKREYALGNNNAAELNASVFIRDSRDADGSAYNAGDVDAEYFTVKRLDKTGWPGLASGAESSVLKGSDTKPTSVIITGTFLSIAGNSKVRKNLTEAAVKAVYYGIEHEDDGLCKTCKTGP